MCEDKTRTGKWMSSLFTTCLLRCSIHIVSFKAKVKKKKCPSALTAVLCIQKSQKKASFLVHPKHDSGKIKIQTPTFAWLAP